MVSVRVGILAVMMFVVRFEGREYTGAMMIVEALGSVLSSGENLRCSYIEDLEE